MMCMTELHGGVCHRTSTPHKSGNKMKEKKKNQMTVSNITANKGTGIYITRNASERAKIHRCSNERSLPYRHYLTKSCVLKPVDFCPLRSVPWAINIPQSHFYELIL